MTKILFVCTGNSCRSVMAQYIMLDKLKRAGYHDCEVDSAGLSVIEGSKIEKNTRKVLKAHGIKSKNRKCQQLKSRMIDDDTIVITMDATQKAKLDNIKRIYSLGDFVSGIDLFDPYGLGIDAYNKCYGILDFILDEIVGLIVGGKL